ncbi:MAG: glycosyltransferase family 2 protein [Bryobacteraceae bacterium]
MSTLQGNRGQPGPSPQRTAEAVPRLRTLGVVVVTHNSEAVIGACLDSLRQADAEIVVVDNASADGTRREVSRRAEITLFANPWNRGFAAAVNQGIDALDCPYVLLLNPDTELLGGIGALVEACGEAGVAGAGGKLVDQSGRPQSGFMVRRFPSAASLSLEALGVNRLWPGNPVNRRYRCADLDPEAPAQVDQPAAAFLLVKREVWRRLGGFDEAFAPLWFEDVDFCRRAAAEGLRMRFVPGAVAKHSGGHSARQLPPAARELYWYGTLLLYAAKHFRRSALAVVCAAVVLGSVLRSVWGIFRWWSLNPVSIYGRVIRLAGLHLILGRGGGRSLSPALAGR